MLTVFRYEIFRDRGLENGSLARVPDAEKKIKKHFGIRLEYPHLLPRNEDRITTLTVQDADVTRVGERTNSLHLIEHYASLLTRCYLISADDTGLFYCYLYF